MWLGCGWTALTVAAVCGCRPGATHTTAATSLVGRISAEQLDRRDLPMLSVPVRYRPCAPAPLPAGVVPGAVCVSGYVQPAPGISRIAVDASAEVQQRADADALHAVALIDLRGSTGAGIGLDRSINYLEMASGLDVLPASVMNDLAAAYIVRAGATNDVRDLIAAAEYADSAQSLDHNALPPRFNLALTLERLGIKGQAVAAWRAVQVRDSSSPWSIEAETHVRELAPAPNRSATPTDSDAVLTAMADSSPEIPMNRGWDDLLGRWGEAVAGGDTALSRLTLDRAARIARELVSHHRDESLSDAVEAIRHASGNQLHTRELATAHNRYAEARKVYLASDYRNARRLFAEVSRTSGRSVPLGQWSTLFLGASLVYDGRAAVGERILVAAAAQSDSTRYPAISGRAWWSLGTTRLRGGRINEGRAAYRRAEATLGRAGESANVGALQQLQMDALFSIGDNAAAIDALYRALHTLRRYKPSVWLHNALYLGAQRLECRGVPSRRPPSGG